jgi:hypothetical protein
MLTEQKIRQATIDVFKSVLHHINGYSKKNIEENKLAEDCEGDELWDEIYEAIKKSHKK